MTFQNLLVDDTALISSGAGAPAAFIRTITIHRPTVLNALNHATIQELGRAVADVAAHPELRALILTGSGEKSFVAGADVSEFNALSPEQARFYSAEGHAVFDRLGSLDVPVIAAVNGFALGGGLELALACDFIYASDNARLGLVEVGLGLVPGFGGVARLSRRVGKAMASELLFSAAQVKAEEALRIGLVNKVFPQTELLAATLACAETIAKKGPLAVAAVKRLLREGESADLRVANTMEQSAFGLAFATEDRSIGVDAFTKKQTAAFVKR
ncbi:MAG: enoyl-CoA hydratase-related protein [Deltaproteobacteria bacterium]|nr:enoyl-CoA hydratase-related protein [Deltaproteobacteria bacterium]